MRAKLRAVNTELKRRRHQPLPVQGQWLGSVVRGHLAYYAVPGNTDRVSAFRTQAPCLSSSLTLRWVERCRYFVVMCENHRSTTLNQTLNKC